MEEKNTPNKGCVEVKQAFLSNAISDISSYIHLVDTKVSIMMAAVVALVVGTFSCLKEISDVLSQIKPCSWIGVAILIFFVVHLVSIISVFIFGILTLRGHSCKVDYKSKWFLPQSTAEYSFDAYKNDVFSMDDEDIIENMTAELYKLNDINRQKLKSNKWALRAFSVYLISTASICLLLFL